MWKARDQLWAVVRLDKCTHFLGSFYSGSCISTWITLYFHILPSTFLISGEFWQNDGSQAQLWSCSVCSSFCRFLQLHLWPVWISLFYWWAEPLDSRITVLVSSLPLFLPLYKPLTFFTVGLRPVPSPPFWIELLYLLTGYCTVKTTIFICLNWGDSILPNSSHSILVH